ncbi:MAG: hypothetical protein PUC73_12670 [Lachnospiraceae bacterium]|nr:hypothetical protein [Lachnospiraceae bacterium]
MVNRVETIELSGWNLAEVTNEFEVDVKKKIDEGWKLLSHSRYSNGCEEYCIRYNMVRLFPYDKNEV